MDLLKIRMLLQEGKTLKDLKLRVIDYARVSTSSSKQQKSLQNQVEHFEDYIKSNKNWEYVGSYIDDGITGISDIKRSCFMKMIDDAKNNKFDLIVTKEISRFSRNTLDSIKYTRLLLSYGVAVWFLNDNINTALPDAELRLTIMATLAQDEIRRLSERVKFGMREAIKRGEILGNDLLYGYKKNKNTSNLEIITNEAVLVNKIFNMYVIKDFSISKIVKILNLSGYRTRLGNNWSVNTISRMITNPKYKGYYCGKKSEVVDYISKEIKYFGDTEWIIYKDNKRIPPIVKEDIWNLANDKLKSRKFSLNDKIIRNKNMYLYSGKIKCFSDNYIYQRRKFRNNDFLWICGNYLKNKKSSCNSFIIRESELNDIFIDIISKLNIDYNLLSDYLIMIYTKNTNSYKKNVDLSIKKEKLLNLYLEDVLTKKEYQEKLNELKNNKKDYSNYPQNEIHNKLKDIVNSKYFYDIIISLILKEIVVIKDDDSHVILDISLNDINFHFSKLYSFGRGFDVKSTKRYIVYYLVRV